MKVNPSRSTTLDRETIFYRETGEVHHGKSAVANIQRMGQETLDALNPINNISKGIDLAANSGALGVVLAPLIIGWSIFRELAEIVFLPFMLLKDLFDAIVHAFAAIGQKAPQNSETEHNPRSDFHLITPLDEFWDLARKAPLRKTPSGAPGDALPPRPANTGVRVA